MKRRDALKVLLAAPAATFTWTNAEAAQAVAAAQAARATAKPFVPKFFTANEFKLVRTLADIIIPKDERSGSASDVGVPEFMGFMMIDQPTRQVAMRGGLAWLDVECQERFDKIFLDCTDEQRKAVLDDIAWPAKAKPEHRHGVAFFNRFRDLTAGGFWTTKVGIEDLQYLGNKSLTRWNGCPDAALKKLGVSYEG
jgi:hypothetical protein